MPVASRVRSAVFAGALLAAVLMASPVAAEADASHLEILNDDDLRVILEEAGSFAPPATPRAELIRRVMAVESAAKKTKGKAAAPKPPAKVAVAQLLFFAGLAIAVVGSRFLPAEVQQWISGNKMMFYAGVFMCNMAAGSLRQTGAFEVTINGQLAWSRLQTGEAPNIAHLVSLVGKAVGGR